MHQFAGPFAVARNEHRLTGPRSKTIDRDHRLTVGQLTLFLAYVGMLYQPLEQLSYTAWALEGAAAGMQRVFEILDAEDSVPERTGAKPMLLVNQAANTNHWIGIRVVGVQSNRDGIGANVHVFAGGKGWVQEVRSGSSYLSSSDLRLHFGIGAAVKIDRVEIDWPSGRNESFPPPPVDHVVSFTEGTGAVVARP